VTTGLANLTLAAPSTLSSAQYVKPEVGGRAAGIDSGVTNSLARVVMVVSSCTSFPFSSTKNAWLSPVKTMEQERFPNSSIMVVLL